MYSELLLPLVYFSIFDLIFRVFVSKRSVYCAISKILFVVFYWFSLFRTPVKL